MPLSMVKQWVRSKRSKGFVTGQITHSKCLSSWCRSNEQACSAWVFGSEGVTPQHILHCLLVKGLLHGGAVDGKEAPPVKACLE